MRDYFLCANWMAVRNTSLQAIEEILKLDNKKNVSWKEGFLEVHINERFDNPNAILLIPNLEDWTLLVGCCLMDIEDNSHIGDLLSQAYGKVCSFGVDIWMDYHSWLISKNGKTLRYFLWMASDVQEFGEMTEAEKKQIQRLDDSELVFELASEWSFDIGKIDEYTDRHQEAYLYQIGIPLEGKVFDS